MRRSLALSVCVAAAILLVAAKPAATSEPYSFQDDELGSTLDTFSAKHPNATCNRTETVVTCHRGDVLVADADIDATYTFAGPPSASRLVKIGLVYPWRVASAISDGLAGKWGKPQTLLDLSMWQRGRYRIAMKDALRSDYGWVIFTDEVAMAQIKAAAEKRAAEQM